MGTSVTTRFYIESITIGKLISKPNKSIYSTKQKSNILRFYSNFKLYEGRETCTSVVR